MAARHTSEKRPRGQHDPAYQLLRTLLLEARVGAHLTQRDLGALLGRDRSYVWKSEQGERRVDVVDVIRWANACKVDPMELFQKMVAEERQCR